LTAYVPIFGLKLKLPTAMKATLLFTLSALCLLNSGCTLSHNLLRTSVVQPIQYCNYWDEVLERHRFRKVAQLELERARSTARAESDNYSSAPFSIDHERGFEDGFVDFLMYGGVGNPPPLPPRRYWWSDCQKLDGCDAIQDWFKGFQHGVAVAQASGYRDCVTVQLGDALIKDTLPTYMGQFSSTEHAEPDAALRGESGSATPTSLGADAPDLPPYPPPPASTGTRNDPPHPPVESTGSTTGPLPPSTVVPLKTGGTANGLHFLGEDLLPADMAPAETIEIETNQHAAKYELGSFRSSVESTDQSRPSETQGFNLNPALIETQPSSVIRSR
jgi:hypothetical protein